MNHDVVIKETTEEDLKEVLGLWNNGNVMHYVGFPEGLGISYDELLHQWYPNVNQNDDVKHYSIYHKTLGYCGETYYRVEPSGLAALDIKLLPKARGKNIAYTALKYAIKQAFSVGKASACFVDPINDNLKALKLYQRLGFIEKKHPNPAYRKTHTYLEVYPK